MKESASTDGCVAFAGGVVKKHLITDTRVGDTLGIAEESKGTDSRNTAKSKVARRITEKILLFDESCSGECRQRTGVPLLAATATSIAQMHASYLRRSVVIFAALVLCCENLWCFQTFSLFAKLHPENPGKGTGRRCEKSIECLKIKLLRIFVDSVKTWFYGRLLAGW